MTQSYLKEFDPARARSKGNKATLYSGVAMVVFVGGSFLLKMGIGVLPEGLSGIVTPEWQSYIVDALSAAAAAAVVKYGVQIKNKIEHSDLPVKK